MNDLQFPSDHSVIKLTDFFKSLIDKIDNVMDNNASTSEISHDLGKSINSSKMETDIVLGDPAAFEEVSYNSDQMITEDINKHFSDLAAILNKVANDTSNTDMVQMVNSSEDQFSDIPSEIELLGNANMCCAHIIPFTKVPDSPFHLFDTNKLIQTTTFTHVFERTKRSASYYGEHPYSYGTQTIMSSNNAQPGRPCWRPTRRVKICSLRVERQTTRIL